MLEGVQMKLISVLNVHIKIVRKVMDVRVLWIYTWNRSTRQGLKQIEKNWQRIW